MKKYDDLIGDILDKMFKISGYEDVTHKNVEKLHGKRWFHDLTMTLEQKKEWTEYALSTILKDRTLKHRALSEFNGVDLMWGLRVVDENGDTYSDIRTLIQIVNDAYDKLTKKPKKIKL
jgi:hypothetical protein